MAPSRILIVEDEAIVASDIKETLTGLGYTVTGIAKSGEIALEKVEETRPDLVLMDIHLAGTMDGIQAAGEIRAKYSIPVIYLTAYADAPLLERAKVTEPYGYMLKPYDDRELHSVIEMALYKHRMEHRLRESEERFRTLLTSVQLGIVLIEADTHIILDVNPKALEMIGGTRNSLVGSVCHHVMCQAEMGRCPITDLGQTIDDSERTLVTAGGHRLQIQKSVVSTVLNGKQVLIESFVDISSVKNTEEALKSANKKLNLLNNITRHDILNQLTALFLNLDMTLAKIQDPELALLIRQIQRTGENIERQITFTRDYQDVGINTPLWQDIGLMVRDASNDLNTGPVIVTATLGPLEVFADPLLPKVFYNLVDNALRHGETLTRITFRSERYKGGMRIICEDDGVGVPVNLKAGIFNREYFKNTGFGLNLSREILAITGLTITETGEPGNGARFEIQVPEGGYRLPSH